MDKNYLLKSVQAFSKESLLNEWIKDLFQSYNQQHNPMGLEDDFIIQLRREISKGKELLEDNYDILAAIYRYNHSDNQLEFNWDGRSHMETYDEEWKDRFSKWTAELSLIKEIQRPVVKYATQGRGLNNEFLETSMKRAILTHFGLRLKAQKLYQLSA
ncbi:MAG: hypothetical protein ABJG78_06880 [Cyclobacteriaceae bacterium]